MRPRLQLRKGFTLLELSFSITFYTAILVVAVTAFIGILGVYNKAQSLTRTQGAARIAMDSLVRDLRTAQNVQYYPLYDSSVAGSTNPIAAAPAASLTGKLRTEARDYYCITTSDSSRGYAHLWNAPTNRYVLVRLPQGCDTFAGYQQIVDSDVWSDATAAGHINVPPAPFRAVLSATDVGLSATEPGALHIAGKDYRGLVITRVGTPADVPAVWSVQVAVHRGTRVPPINNGFLDQFSAETTLRSVVTTRE